jgi:hypothetical protein
MRNSDLAVLSQKLKKGEILITDKKIEGKTKIDISTFVFKSYYFY